VIIIINIIIIVIAFINKTSCLMVMNKSNRTNIYAMSLMTDIW
jgi:hypothetical protein